MHQPISPAETPGAGGILCAPWRIVHDDDTGIAIADARGQVVWAENYLNLLAELGYDDYVQTISDIRARFAALIDAVNHHAGVAQHSEQPTPRRQVAGENPAPRSTSPAAASNRLEDERNALMNGFGQGAFADGRVRDRIAEIDRQLGVQP